MRQTVLALCVLVLTPLALQAAETTYGKGVTLEEATPIATLVADPGAFAGKTVRVDGVVSAVCEKRGCWMQIADPDSGAAVRIKVDDGVIVFPLEAAGHKASAQGTVEMLPPGGEETGMHAPPAKPEHTEEEGAGCAAKEKPTAFQVHGTGAVVY